MLAFTLAGAMLVGTGVGVAADTNRARFIDWRQTMHKIAHPNLS